MIEDNYIVTDHRIAMAPIAVSAGQDNEFKDNLIFGGATSRILDSTTGTGTAGTANTHTSLCFGIETSPFCVALRTSTGMTRSMHLVPPPRPADPHLLFFTAAPGVTTDAASGIGSAGATLNGTVYHANDDTSTVTFEYGLDATYGTTVTADQSPVSGSTATAVSTAVTGLAANTTYHFRTVGTNAVGVAHGPDVTFTTTPAVTVALDGLVDGASITHTSPFLNLSGTAGATTRPAGSLRLDTAGAAVTSVTWENDRGGAGTAEGTTTWRAPLIPLQPGVNTITLTATDDTGATTTATVTVTQLLYYLAEGATGPFFDLDLLLGNPNGVPAPVTITFLKEDGSTVIHTVTLTANSQLTLRVNDIAGLATAAVSTVVSSDSALPLSVERSMLWDASVPAPRPAKSPAGPSIAPGATHYGGHTAKAVNSPETTWQFAEGSQGFFDTFLLLANANLAAATATVTCLVQGAPRSSRSFPSARPPG